MTFLFCRSQHTFVVCTCKQFVPCTQETDHKQAGKSPHPAMWQGKCQCPQSYRQQSLVNLYETPVVSRTPHIAAYP